MKILHVITSLLTGGAETLLVDLVTDMRLQEYEIDVVVFDGEETPLKKRLLKTGCKVICFSNKPSFYNPLYIIRLARLFQQYDIIHTHNSSPQLFAAVANLFSKKKIVTTEHSTNNRKREQGRLFKYIDKWMYRQYDKIICISTIATDKLVQYLNGNLGGRICTINNGVNIELFHQARPIDELKSDKFIIIMVAGFREAKDQDTLLRAIKLLPKDQYELWLVGDGERRPLLEDLSKKLQVDEYVKFLGIRTDVPNLLKTANVIVMSSHWEGLSLSNIEGMAAGKPFVASDVIGLRDVTKGYGILFPHEGEKYLASILTKLHDDPTYYEQIANKCYERAQQYDIKKTVTEYLEVYKSLQLDKS